MARTAAKQAAPEPEIDLTEMLEKDPTSVNKAEAEWLVDCTGLPIEDLDPMELVERVVQLVAGKAHREWQKSAAAEALHGEIADKRAATAEERAAAREEREAERERKAEEKANAPKKPRGRAKATSLADEEEEEAPAPKPRRGRPAKAKPVEEDEDDAPAPAKRRDPARRAKAGAEAPF